jgi:hypothetical protein
MRRLEVLTIEGPMEETNLPYNGELANRLPCLRRLEMRHFLHEAMLSDLLRGAACSLRVVDLHLQPLNDALRGALELCTELRRLQVELNDADVVRCMPGLHTLILYSHPTHNALQRLQNSLSHCSPLVSLRHLELTLELYNVHPGYWTHLARVLTDLAAVALGTTHLRITIDNQLDTEVVQNAEQCVEQVVAHLPRLQVAQLRYCSPTLLHHLAAKEDLRVLDATFVCPTEQREQWESATNDFYNRRPEVKAYVDFFDSSFGFQSVWKK